MSSQLFFQDKFSNLRYDVVTKAQTAILSTDFESDYENCALKNPSLKRSFTVGRDWRKPSFFILCVTLGVR